ncbi:arylsulfatase [Echinicola pacifica]|uniref:Arylsulfatase n=1 Tax=Echinicola pacifica TaxID=346377 RepID=A0A918UKD3_9BACT|nr:sulfatase [Echinicola pacifica]GGZ16656.1 arylsulfatase [Echinicola pacifica]
MKTINTLCLLLAVSQLFSCNSAHTKVSNSTAKRPNVIFILADDYGIMDTQGYAQKILGIDPELMYYETPNLDRMMSEGISFSQAYANQLCSPTRASILTGKYAGRLGFTTAMPPRETYYNQNLEVPEGYYAHDVLSHADNIKIEQAMLNSTSNSAIPSGADWDKGKDELSIAEAMEDYHSAFIGKWHVGGFGAKGYQPENQGFEALAWYDAGGSAYYNWKNAWNINTKGPYPNMPQSKWEMGDAGMETGEEYLTDDLTEQALSFIEREAKNKDKPFFLYFSHFAVHSPYQGPEEEINYYEGKDSKGWNGHHDPVYATMVKNLDESVGAILDKLEELGIEENTLVVFMSDNGGIDSKITPKGDGTDNSPFLGGKACLTEGGIRVPLIFRWKGTLPEKKWVDIPVDCTDIFPSLLDAAGYPAEQIVKSKNLDGQSLLPLLTDPQNKKKSYTKTDHFWHYPFNVIYNNPTDGYPLTPHSAIRSGDYKLIFDWHGRLALYNIEKDPYEKNNLSGSDPELTNELFGKLMSWMESNIEARYWPIPNPEYDPQKDVRDEKYIDLLGQYQSQGYVITNKK